MELKCFKLHAYVLIADFSCDMCFSFLYIIFYSEYAAILQRNFFFPIWQDNVLLPKISYQHVKENVLSVLAIHSMA